MMNFVKQKKLTSIFKLLRITQDTQILKKNMVLKSFVNSVIFMNLYLLFSIVENTFIIRNFHRRTNNSENRTSTRNVNFNK